MLFTPAVSGDRSAFQQLPPGLSSRLPYIARDVGLLEYPLISLDRFGKRSTMSALVFEEKVDAWEGINQNDRLWFPRWVRRYALTQRGGADRGLTVNQHSVISFSRSLLHGGAPAWQRWQAVRALECYRDLVLERAEPDLSHVILTLARLGKRERNVELDAPPTDEELAVV